MTEIYKVNIVAQALYNKLITYNEAIDILVALKRKDMDIADKLMRELKLVDMPEEKG